jgi:hypothetical protein
MQGHVKPRQNCSIQPRRLGYSEPRPEEALHRRRAGHLCNRITAGSGKNAVAVHPQLLLPRSAAQLHARWWLYRCVSNVRVEQRSRARVIVKANRVYVHMTALGIAQERITV